MQFINDVIDNTVLKLLLSSLLTEIAFVFRNVFFYIYQEQTIVTEKPEYMPFTMHVELA